MSGGSRFQAPPPPAGCVGVIGTPSPLQRPLSVPLGSTQPAGTRVSSQVRALADVDGQRRKGGVQPGRRGGGAGARSTPSRGSSAVPVVQQAGAASSSRPSKPRARRQQRRGAQQLNAAPRAASSQQPWRSRHSTGGSGGSQCTTAARLQARAAGEHMRSCEAPAAALCHVHASWEQPAGGVCTAGAAAGCVAHLWAGAARASRLASARRQSAAAQLAQQRTARTRVWRQQ
jgi:hypothetical protein